MIRLQLRGDLPFWDMRVPLDGVTYTLEFRLNVREEKWYLRILDEDGTTVILGGQKIVAYYPVNPFRADRKPPGALSFVSPSGEDPGPDDLGDFVLLYVSEAELAAALED